MIIYAILKQIYKEREEMEKFKALTKDQAKSLDELLKIAVNSLGTSSASVEAPQLSV